MKQESQEAFEERRSAGENNRRKGIDKASSSDGHDACGCIGHTHGSGIFVLLCIGDVFIPTTAGKEREVGIMKLISEFWKEEDAVGVVEVILILVVLIGLVLIFKKQLVSLVNSLMEKVTNQSNTV